MGSTPHLRRILTRRDLVIYGLVLLGPTAPYPVFGLVQQITHGHAALAYLAAMVGVLFTALSYAKMAGAFPAAGSTYTFTRRALSEHAGFLAGWSMMLDYFLIPLVSVIYGALTAHRLMPSVPYAAWALLFTAGLTAVNIFGIRMTARASDLMMIIMSVCAVTFIVLCGRFVMAQHGVAGLFDTSAIFQPHTFAMGALMTGAGVAALSYIGFDAISTLAEDTVDPKRDIGFATVLVCILQTAICFVTVYLATLVWPDYKSYPEAETVILDISTRIGGVWLFGALSFVLLVAALASALTGQAGASRLLYGMGRDRVLPPSVFAYLHPRFATPTRAIYLMGGLCAFAAVALRFEIAVELLNFGAFAGFVLVNVSVIRHFYFRLGQRGGLGTLTNLIFPALGAAVCVYLWLSLSTRAKMAGFLWLAAGVLYLAVLTRGFRVAPKELGALREEA